MSTAATNKPPKSQRLPSAAAERPPFPAVNRERPRFPDVDRLPCDAAPGECVLESGHRSAEHGDDHRTAAGVWWNVGQEMRNPLEPVPDALPDALPEATRITTVLFLHPELLFGRASVSVTAKSCLSIEPVVMAQDGRLVPPSDGQPSCGLLIRRRVSQDGLPREYIARHLVPWSNIGHVDFGL